MSPRDDIFWASSRPIFDPWWSRILIDHVIADEFRRQHREKEKPHRDLIHEQVAHSVRQIDDRFFDKWMRTFSGLAEILPLSYLQTFAPYYKQVCPQLTGDIIRQRKIMVRGIFRALQVPNTAFCNKHADSFLHSALYFYSGEILVKMSKSYGMRLIAYADQSEAALQARIVALVRGLQIMSADEVGNLFGRAEEYSDLLQILRALILNFKINLPDFMAVSAEEVENILDIPACLLPVGVA